MENSQITISLNNNELITWDGVKRPSHVNNVGWVKFKGHPTFYKILINNKLKRGMAISRKLSHVCIEREMAPPIYIGGPSHLTFQIHVIMNTLRTIIAIALSQAITLAVFGLATGSIYTGWSLMQYCVYIIVSAYYAAVFLYIFRRHHGR